MSYNVHNFQNGEVIEASPINEMDAQILLNSQKIEDVEEHMTDIIDDTAGEGDTDKVWSADKLTKIETDFETVTGNDLIEFIDGYYIATNKSAGDTIDLTPVEGSGTSSYAIVNCSEGDRFTLNGTGGSTGRLWAFVDENNKLIVCAVANNTVTNKVLMAPVGSAKLILCIVTTTIGMCCKGVWISGHVDRIDGKLLPKNLAEGMIFLSGKYIHDSTGVVTNSTTGRASRSIDVSAFTKIVYPRFVATGTQHWGAAFYDEDRVFISGQRCITSADVSHYVMTGIDVPQTAKYFRWTEMESMPISELYEASDYYSKQPKVQDVQVNGASVVTDGVAEIPLAGTSQYGVVRVLSGDHGVQVSANGLLQVIKSSDNDIKSGGQQFRPIVPASQHTSVFYGLAKAAGDLTQISSSNALGTYTDEAKIAIQKMLGIYQAPWELIREDTVTNATQANIEITVDGDGNPLELTDIFMYFWFPVQETEAKIADGSEVDLYYGDNEYIGGFFGGNSYTQAAGAAKQQAYIKLEQEANSVFLMSTKFTGGGSMANWQSHGNHFMEVYHPFKVFNSPVSFEKIIIKKVTGTAQYKLFGKRKWN